MKKKLIEGPLGLRTTDAVAKSLEALLKTLPQECRTLRRKAALPDHHELVKGEKADISMVSVESMDSDKEVVLSEGLDLDTFRKNPIVCWSHDYEQPAIGKAMWIKAVEGGIRAKTKYAERPKEWQGQWMADAIWSLTQQGIIKGKSIGFLPTKMRPPHQNDFKARPEWKDANAIIENAVLLEYSACNLPVNSQALVEAVAKGLADFATLRKLGMSVERKERPAQPDIMAMLMKALGNIKIDPDAIAREVHDRLSGKV